MAKAGKNLIGVGLYSPAEIARILHVNTRKYSRWLFAQNPVFEPQLGRKDKIVTFMDFAQSLSIADIRQTAGVPLQKIRRAYRFAQEEYKVEFPFGVEHGMFIFGDLKTPERCNIGIFLPDHKAPEGEQKKEYLKRVQVSGKNKGAILINEVVKIFSRRLVFNEKTFLADHYIAHESHGFKIIMNPSIRFGKPYVEHVGYEAETLAEAAVIEGGIDRAARLYHVDPEAIRASLDFYKHLENDPIPPKPAAA